MEKSTQKDVFCREEIIGSSTVVKVGSARIVLAMDGVAPYHMLVIPIRHAEQPKELSSKEINDIFEAVHRVEMFYKSKGIDGYKIMRLSGAAAGQTIPHIHWHIIPGTSDFVTGPKQRKIHYAPEELGKAAKELAQEFG